MTIRHACFVNILLLALARASWINRDKEGIFLFNDTLYTFYLWLYGIRHIINNHSDNQRVNLLLPLHGLLFLISNMGYFICTIPWTAHIMDFVTPVMEHWLEWEMAKWVHHEGSIQWPITPWADALPWSYISLPDTYEIITPFYLHNKKTTKQNKQKN